MVQNNHSLNLYSIEDALSSNVEALRKIVIFVYDMSEILKCKLKEKMDAICDGCLRYDTCQKSLFKDYSSYLQEDKNKCFNYLIQ